MSSSGAELKRLIFPTLACAVLLAAGAGLVWSARNAEGEAQRELAAALSVRNENAERLARIAEEEREVNEKLAVYRHLQALHILGEERRLEWADAVGRIRKQRELLDLRYRVERQKLLVSVPGKPANVDFFASTMNVDLALLHEEDLLRFLADLRLSGNAYYSVKRCALSRTEQPAAAPTLAARLRASCEIDLITIIDRAAKE
jgi:hypothetical protein